MELETVKKLINHYLAKHEVFVTAAKEAEKYYENEDSILNTGAAAVDAINQYLKQCGQNPLHSADNRIPLNWHRILVDQKIGYLFTYPPQFDTDDSSNIDFQSLLGDDYEKIIKKLGVDASNTGRAWIQYWQGVDGRLEYYYVDPKQVLPIYDETNIKKPLKMVIRYYTALDEQGEEYVRYELWDEKEVCFYYHKSKENIDKLIPEMINLTKAKVVKHGFDTIPFIKFSNNSLEVSDLKMCKQVIDCLDKAWSGFANDIDDIQEVIWVLKNYTADIGTPFKLDEHGEPLVDERGLPIKNEYTPDLLQMLKAKKVAEVGGDGGIETVTSEIPYEARQAFLDGLVRQLFISAMAVDPRPENTGNSSGVYIDFLYGLLELKAGLMETEFRGSLNRLVRAVSSASNDIKITQTWTRNKPRNDLEIAQIINGTSPDVMSNQTKTKVHPLVDDWVDERKQIDKEAEDVYPEKPLFKDDVDGEEK